MCHAWIYGGVCEIRPPVYRVVPPLSPLYQGLYRVLDKKEKFFKLEIRGQAEVISVDRLKPHLGTAPVTAASPP